MFREVLALALTAFCLNKAMGTKTADMDFLHNQKKISELFFYMDQSKLVGSECYEVGRSYDIESNINFYNDTMMVGEFMDRFKLGMLHTDALFSAYHKEHQEELRFLFRLFHSAKDFATLYKTACWARLHLNREMLVTALTTAITYRSDCKHIVLPPIYEVYPQVFFNNEIIGEAKRVKMMGLHKKNVDIENTDTYLVNINYTTHFMKHYTDVDNDLSYFTEDVGLGNYYYYLRNAIPFWLSLNDLGIPNHNRGDLYYLTHQHLMAHYYLERLSNGLGEIEDFDFYKKFGPGYYSTLVYSNGVSMPGRDPYSEIPFSKYKYVKEIENIEHRILDAIDTGFIVDKEGKQFALYSPGGLNYLGSVIEGNYDTCNRRFYGAIDVLYRDIFSANNECKHKNCFIPSAVQLLSTSVRDPAFYSLYKKILSYFLRYKNNLSSYTPNDLEFPGVSIEDVQMDKLYTFFEDYDYMINNAVTVENYKEGMNFLMKVRKSRLNHKPFTFKFNIKSEKNTRGFLHIFIGPSSNDNVSTPENYFYYNWHKFAELDQFVVDLKAGMNTIERRSIESAFAAKDLPSGDHFYKKLMKSVRGSEQFTHFEKVYDYPMNLYLPKGRVGGFPFKFFFFIQPIDESKAGIIDLGVFGEFFYDGKPFGYPLDRPMHPWYTDAKNMFFKDANIYHMKESMGKSSSVEH